MIKEWKKMSTVSTRGDIKSQRQSRNWIFGREIADGSISKTILKRTVKRGSGDRIEVCRPRLLTEITCVASLQIPAGESLRLVLWVSPAVIAKVENSPSAEGSAFTSCPASLQTDVMKVWLDPFQRAFLRCNFHHPLKANSTPTDSSSHI